MKDERQMEAEARALIGTPTMMAERLLALMSVRAPSPQPGDTSVDYVRRHQANVKRWAEEEALRFRLASDFGAARGWSVASSTFGLLELQRGGRPGNWRRRHGEWPRAFFDHPTFFRDGSRRAAGVVGQPYRDPRFSEAEAAGWAEENSLRVSFPLDFPSWWFPGATALVVVQAASPGSAGLPLKGS